jgi:hypothetical protein
MLGGWLVAVLLVLGIAGAVRFLGESADAGSPDASGAEGPAGSPHPIEFGTTLTPERLVPVEARAASFTRGDTFAYAVPDAEPAVEVFVEVRRVDGGPTALVQEAVEAQAIPDGPALIGFTVPADVLLDAWGPGAYEMGIHLAPDGPAIARGRFVLVEPPASP